MNTLRPIVLLVEDNEEDRYLAKRALSKGGLKAVFEASDGKEAVDYLMGNDRFSDRNAFPLPDIILLDLKLPEMDGHEIAEWIKTRAELSSCLVYILSSSGEPRDRERAATNARGYFVKPLTVANVADVSRAFCEQMHLQPEI
ncbi:two-component system response regulator [Verrucomicrobia bacterium LW23]|nr:two-component system response regulator [Verrucomicrobia bacterium LW23]